LIVDYSAKYRGFDGEIMIEESDIEGVEPDFIAAAQEIGLPLIDPNAPYDLGVFKVQLTTSKGVRDAPYMSMIRSIRSRKTLTIRKFSTVNKVR